MWSVQDSEYTQTEVVQESVEAILVRAHRRADGRQVLLKILQDGGGEPLRRLLIEREIGKIPDPSTILCPIDLATIDGRHALVLEYFGGYPLERELAEAIGVEAALEIAIRVATKLGDLHAHGIVHRDLKPQNIFFDRRSGEVRITGLGVALSSIGAYRPSSEPGLIEGTFAYMAPEQTGQRGRLVDERADLYSLGVVLYRMLSGTLPLEATDALGWIHVHVAKRPPPLTSVVEGMAPVVAAVVDKLLAKDPEERYQTAGGLVADLQDCLVRWRGRRGATPFELGRRDVPDLLRFPRRLHGRDAEIRALAQAFASASAGAGRLVLLVGSAGSGKSSLAKALEAQVVARGGIFLEGKHEPLRRDVPYFGVTQALEQLAGRLLMESDDDLAAWRTRLRAALGANASLLGALVPRLALILGELSPVEQPSPLESPDRFKLLFQRLLETVASAHQPFVLFLDDLQWADSASIGLLEQVLANPQTEHVLSIGSYRGDDIAADHPLSEVLARLRRRGLVTEITVPPLSTDAIAQILVDALRCPMPEATTLAAVLRDRADGNPLFVIELMRTLYQQGLVRFDHSEGGWRWDIEQIRRVPLAEGAAELVLAKLGRIPPPSLEPLRVGACLGIEFRADDVSAALARPIEAVERDLLEATALGLLLHSGRTFRFPHDRIREAAYSLLLPAQRAVLHLQIGRALLARSAGSARDRGDFVVADQLNCAASLITAPSERTELAALDLAVGRKAASASAHESAVQYFAAGMAVLDARAWENAYDIAYGLHLERAACELVLGHFAEAERLLHVVLEWARTPSEHAAAYSTFIELRMTQGDVRAAVELARQGLRACGVDWPDRATEEEARDAVIEASVLLGDTPIKTLAELPRATDVTAQAITDLVSHIGTPVFYYDEKLFTLLASRFVRLTLQWGVSEGSPPIFVAFGLVLSASTGRYDDAWRLGRVAYELAQRPGLGRRKHVVCIMFASLINYWRHHVRTDLPYLEEALEAAHQLGDLTYVCYAENHLVMTRLIMGANLAELEVESARRTKRVADFGFDEMADLMSSRHLLIQSLRGNTLELGSLGTPERSEAELDLYLQTERTPLTLCWHYIDQLQANFIAGRYDRAVAAGRAAAVLLHTSLMFPIVGEHAFYFALALACSGRPTEPGPAADDAALLDGCQRQLERWSKSCPENFSHKHALVSAESARLRGDDLAAMRDYEHAIRSAQDNGFVQIQAIAYELAARFYRSRGFTQFADLYLRAARRAYSQWGATAKTRGLDQPTETVAARPEQLELLAVTQASQALSAELVRPRLLDRLLEVMLRYAGARRCSFVATPAEAYVAETEALAPGVESSGGLPDAVLNYVRHTHERVLLHDATLPNPFSSDPYLLSRRPRSVLCLPVARMSRLLGLIYLENDLAPGVFNDERVTVLEVLSAQAAISLDSSALFADLERENAQRRHAEASLTQSREQLRAILENLVDAVVVCDKDGNVTLVNQAAVRLFGLTLTEREIKPIDDFADIVRLRHPDGRPFATFELPLVRALAGEAVTSAEATFTDRRERDVSLRLSAAPIKDENGSVVGAVEAASDITQQVELDRLRDQFLRMAAHELKTPVAVLSGYAELLQAREQQIRPEQQHMLDALVRGARRIDRIISDLVFLWQLRLGRIALVEEELELGELLSRVASRLEPSPGVRRVEVSTVRPVIVLGDRLFLEKVFTHVIDNALRYSPEGGLVEVSLRVPSQGGAEVSIRDHGIGIAAARQARIFEPFYRAHADTPYDFGGMGVGLYFSKIIVGRHGGVVRFESREREGSTFTIWLPSAPGAGDDGPPREARRG